MFTDGRLAYKYFHYWKAGDREERIAFPAIAGGPPVRVQDTAGPAGGQPAGGERRRGISLRDGQRLRGWPPGGPADPAQGNPPGRTLPAATFIRTISWSRPQGLRLIDYGSDLVPVDDSEFEQMCRRAFLTYRFPFRSDLKQLMTESLTNPRLPELTGLDQFRRALDARGLDELYYRPMADLVASESSRIGAGLWLRRRQADGGAAQPGHSDRGLRPGPRPGTPAPRVPRRGHLRRTGTCWRVSCRKRPGLTPLSAAGCSAPSRTTRSFSPSWGTCAGWSPSRGPCWSRCATRFT